LNPAEEFILRHVYGLSGKDLLNTTIKSGEENSYLFIENEITLKEGIVDKLRNGKMSQLSADQTENVLEEVFHAGQWHQLFEKHKGNYTQKTREAMNHVHHTIVANNDIKSYVDKMVGLEREAKTYSVYLAYSRKRKTGSQADQAFANEWSDANKRNYMRREIQSHHDEVKEIYSNFAKLKSAKKSGEHVDEKKYERYRSYVADFRTVAGSRRDHDKRYKKMLENHPPMSVQKINLPSSKFKVTP